jgi:general nucleoside transport system ATP-binding protein
MENISKSFPGVKANRDINMEVRSGEVLGLLGENGAGKTTLMNILYGLYRPDSGKIYINEKDRIIRSPRDSMDVGIGMIHQHFMLVQNHSVIENIALGYTAAPFLFPLKSLKNKLKEFSDKYGFGLDPDAMVWELSAGQQQKVEILKALFLNADLLIMDEPTSVLTPPEIEELFSIIRRMTDEGHSIILISHKLEEIMEICSRVTVLRKGEVVGKAEVKDMCKADLARMMIGRDVVFSFTKKTIPRGEEVLRVEALRVIGDRGIEAVRSVDLSVHKNEIFGIAGVSGNGQQELVETITGLRKPVSGTIQLGGQDITKLSVRQIHDRGITHVPEERIKFGIVSNMVLFENAVLKQHHSSDYSRSVFLNYESIKKHAGSLVENYQVSTPSLSVPMKNLSGGNIQKLILGREMEAKPQLLVAAHPTYGLDVGATEYIRRQLLKKREEGNAILLVSEDLEELFEVCDRIAVIFKGEIMGILDDKSLNIDKIGLMMTGSKWQDGAVV